jgi:hypothetical protein
MPSGQATALYQGAKNIAANLYCITITDAWYQKGGGNIETASESSQSHSMMGVLAGIKGVGGYRKGLLKGSVLKSSPEEWIRQGRRTLGFRKGICTDCAAAAAVELIRFIDSSDYEAKVEIISSGTHAFVIVNREGALDDPDNWGDDAFGIDIWMQNQFPKGKVKGAFWVAKSHSVSQFIRDNARRLRVEATLRSVIEPLI